MKNPLLLVLFIVCFSALGFAQDPASEQPAKLLNLPDAAYPQVAKDAGIGGKVTVRVTVNAGGGVTGAEFGNGPGAICGTVTTAPVMALRAAAVDAARKARFTPAMKNGIAIDSTAIVTVDFGESVGKPGEMRLDRVVGVADDKPSEGKVVSGQVLNGKALSLPAPSYPPAARAVRASGAVRVLLLIDEDGSAYTAEAVSGHPLLRLASVQAACSARFTSTLLEGQPVKVSGIITYNFVP